jgi:hypothetical protein
MADLSITISNTLTPVGIGEANIWGTMLWNDHWGSMADAWQDVNKGIANSLSLADTIPGKVITHRIDDNTLTLADSVEKAVTISQLNSIGVASLVVITRQSGNWTHIFPTPTQDGADKLFDNFELFISGT